jgi:hypothetical protein
MHRILHTLLAFSAILMPAASMAQGLSSPSAVNRHQGRDGVLRLYGACGPQNALRKVADAWERSNDLRVRITCGPEPSWSRQAQVDADIIWGTSEQSMTAFLQSFPSFQSTDVIQSASTPAAAVPEAGDDCGPSPTGDSVGGVASGVLKMFQRRWNSTDNQMKRCEHLAISDPPLPLFIQTKQFRITFIAMQDERVLSHLSVSR